MEELVKARMEVGVGTLSLSRAMTQLSSELSSQKEGSNSQFDNRIFLIAVEN